MKRNNDLSQIRTHRVGSITAGITMMVLGVLFLIHVILGVPSYEVIFKLWPVAIIGLGAEILISNFYVKNFIYDTAAVCLMALIILFSIAVAAAEKCISMLPGIIIFN